MISQIRSNLNSAHLDIIYNSKLRLVHKYKMHHHGTVIRRRRPDPNYFVGASASQRNAMMGSNPGEPGKKFVKNDFTNQVKFELSTLRHYL